MDRFWSKVKKGDPDECWEWQASLRNGYGQLYWQVRGKPQLAHRIAYQLTHGSIPEGQVVRHSCDNKCCCNPAHLELGSQGDNVRDGVRRNLAGVAKLTTEQVKEIRDCLVRSEKPYGLNKRLAEQYGVHVTTIERIKAGKMWKYREAEPSI